MEKNRNVYVKPVMNVHVMQSQMPLCLSDGEGTGPGPQTPVDEAKERKSSIWGESELERTLW